MSFRLRSIVAVSSLFLATAALAQSNTTASIAPTDADSATLTSVPMTPRFACLAAAQKFAGQDRQDQMQLCMVQARLDCLKQAIDQKIVGPQRKEFLVSCAQ